MTSNSNVTCRRCGATKYDWWFYQEILGYCYDCAHDALTNIQCPYCGAGPFTINATIPVDGQNGIYDVYLTCEQCHTEFSYEWDDKIEAVIKKVW